MIVVVDLDAQVHKRTHEQGCVRLCRQCMLCKLCETS